MLPDLDLLLTFLLYQLGGAGDPAHPKDAAISVLEHLHNANSAS